jgi:hypothetical protein
VQKDKGQRAKDKGRPGRSSFCPLLFVLCPLLLVGCSLGGSSGAKTASSDPLLGLFPGADPVKPPPAQAAATVPPLPPAQSTTAPAALAGGSGGRPPLAIPDNNGVPAQLTAGPRDAGWNLAPNPNPKVVPVPRDDGASANLQRIGSWAAPGTPATTAAPTSAQLDAQLKERGVVGQKADPVAGGLHLTCYVARPDNPSAIRVYEVTAADYAAAAQAILRQIGP